MRKKGRSPVGFDELQAAVEEALGEAIHRHVFLRQLDARFAAVEAERFHVVAVGQAEEQVEAVAGRRPGGRDVAEMPFADEGVWCSRASAPRRW